MSASFQPLVRNDGWRCCYPGRDAGYLPDRSERARLTHSAPTLVFDDEAFDRPGRAAASAPLPNSPALLGCDARGPASQCQVT
jgi:hypothetical protein